MKNSQKIVLGGLLLIGSIVGTPNVSKAMQNIKGKTQNELSEKLSLTEIIKKYLESNISVNGSSLDFSNGQMSAELLADTINNRKMYLVFDHKFDGYGLQDDQIHRVKLPFEIIARDNNYYIKFTITESDFDEPLVGVPGGLILDDVVYDVIVPDDDRKNSDLRIVPNSQKTWERIKNKIESIGLQKSFDIKPNPEFENTQLTGLNNISFSKEIIKEADGYSRSVYLSDTVNGKYRPIVKLYFDKKGNVDTKRIFDEYTVAVANNPLRILGEVLQLKLWLHKDEKIFRIRIEESFINALENRLKAHRMILIEYINNARIGPESKFSEFNKVDEERPRHVGRKKFLFKTNLLELNLFDDEYILNSSRSDEKNIRFGFDYAADYKNDKVFVRSLSGEKIEAEFRLNSKGEVIGVKGGFVIEMNKDDVYAILDVDGTLTIYKIDKGLDSNPDLSPEFVGNGSKYIMSESNLSYYDKEKLEMEYFESGEGRKIVGIPLFKTEKKQRKLGEVSQDIYTDDLVDMKRFPVSQLQKLNLSQEDIRNVFLALMQKEDIKLQGRQNIRMLIDAKTGKYEYYKARQGIAGRPISLDKDDDLYQSADKVMDIIKKRLEIISKIENVQLWLSSKGKPERFEGAIGGGRGLEKGSLSTENKLAFLNGETNLLSQEIFWGEGESTNIDYMVKKTGALSFIVKDSKAVKLDKTWFLKRIIVSILGIQNYRISFEEGNVFKLFFEAK